MTWCTVPHHVQATYLIDARGSLSWKDEGDLNLEPLTAALDQHPTRTAPSAGSSSLSASGVERRPPTSFFEHAPGEQMFLSKLQGRQVQLLFWTTSSSACVAQLERLKSEATDLARQGTALLAINDGNEPDEARAVFAKHGLATGLVIDTKREISSLYNVNCWPTSILLSEMGQVIDVRFGLERK